MMSVGTTTTKSVLLGSGPAGASAILTTTATGLINKSGVETAPKGLIESMKLNWNVMSLSIVNTVLLSLNLILILILIYAVYANSRKVIRYIKNYVRFYSQVLR